MAAISVTAANVSANEVRGAIVRWYQTGEALNVGQAVYLDSNNLAWRAKADSQAHATAVGVVAFGDNFYGEKSIVSGGQCGVVVYGPMNGFASMSQAQAGWISATAGQIDDTAPTGGAWQFQIGHAIDDQTFFVDPNPQTPASHA
jgi:hypothetical protein